MEESEFWDFAENELNRLNITKPDGERLSINSWLVHVILESKTDHTETIDIKLSLHRMEIQQGDKVIQIRSRAACEIFDALEEVHRVWHEQLRDVIQQIEVKNLKNFGFGNENAEA